MTIDLHEEFDNSELEIYDSEGSFAGLIAESDITAVTPWPETPTDEIYRGGDFRPNFRPAPFRVASWMLTAEREYA